MVFSISLRAPKAYRIGLSVFYFIQGLTFASWASRIPDIKNSLQLSEAALGGVLLTLPIGQIIGIFLSGFLVNRFGSKNVLTVSSVLYPASLILLGLAETPLHLVGVLALFGLFSNLYNIAINTQAVAVEGLYGRSIMAGFHGLWSLAGFAGGIIGALMIARGFSPLIHFCIIFFINMLLLSLAQRSLLPRDTRSKETTKTSIFSKPDKSILILGSIAFACMICEGTMFDWSGVYFEKVIAAPGSLSRLGFVAFMCAMAMGRFAADYLITRFGVEIMLKGSGIAILSGILFAVALPQVFPATIGLLIAGLGVSSVVPLTYSLAGKSKNISPSVALATVSSVGFLGFLIGPPVIGFLAEIYGLRIAFAIVAVLGLGTTLLASNIKKEM